MITLKKIHNINDSVFLELINKFNNVVRYSYNRRIKDNINKTSLLEQYVKLNMLNIGLDASWIKAAVKKSMELQTNTKLYFGGKGNFFKRKFKKKVEFNKNVPLEMRGSCSDKGNRKAEIINNKLFFKPFKRLKYEIKLDLSKNESRMLSVIEEECKLNKNYFNIELDQKYVYISFNEPVMETHTFKKNRYLGIDLNPNWIALSIMDNGIKEIFKEIIDLRELNKCDKNKKEYELSIISKHIINICKQYKAEYICLEDLNISSNNKGLGKKYNKLANNDWNRNYFVNNLVKWLNINGIKYMKVNPFYTSFIGQIKNEKDYDSIAASKEVSYRGYLMNKGLKIYDYINQFLSNSVTTRWKEMLPNVETYKDLYNHFKNQKKSKNSYRFLFTQSEKDKYSYLG